MNIVLILTAVWVIATGAWFAAQDDDPMVLVRALGVGAFLVALVWLKVCLRRAESQSLPSDDNPRSSDQE